jgi:hypothetical protein
MVGFKRKSIGLEINLKDTVKNFHNLDLNGILGVGLVKWREMGRTKIPL